MQVNKQTNKQNKQTKQTLFVCLFVLFVLFVCFVCLFVCLAKQNQMQVLGFRVLGFQGLGKGTKTKASLAGKRENRLGKHCERSKRQRKAANKTHKIKQRQKLKHTNKEAATTANKKRQKGAIVAAPIVISKVFLSR